MSVELCDECKEIIGEMVIVKPNFLKYLMIKADVSMDELMEIQKIEKEKHYHNPYSNTTFRKEAPTFKADKTKGEGKASKKELAFRQELLDRLKECYDSFKPIINNKNISVEAKIAKLKTITDRYAEDSKKTVRKNIPEIWEIASNIAVKKLKELGIEPVDHKQTKQDAYNSFIKWQLFKVEQNAEYLRLDLTNKLYGKNYFEITYG